MLPAKRARFEEEDAAADARERWYGSRFQPIAEYRQPKLALEQLREKYQRNYCLIFESLGPPNIIESRLTTSANNLMEWSERKGALITIRSCYVRIPNAPIAPATSARVPSVLPIELVCSFDQDNMFAWNNAENRWLQNNFMCTMPCLCSKDGTAPGGAGVAVPFSATYQAQADDLNKIYVPAPFSNITVELRDPWNGQLASTSLEGEILYSVTYFKLVLDVQFIE
jgi:hypothetical protein